MDRGPTAKLRIVWGAGNNERYLGEEFFDGECDEKQRSQFQATFQLVADNGQCRIDTLYKYPLPYCGNLGEFKVHKKRLFFYRDGNDLVITHGATKKTGKTDPNDIIRVERIEKEIKAREEQLKQSALRVHPQDRGKKR
ncbi:type II toxin-antitoxin system RelE/ParE family toxin [Corallococcus sp. AB018]|uniref:type II toxin-antitoxin system RelE/ParE family toxin n=1 Tax=Corallococcus sp. AB018 TaxID=2316715 RepID=UPI0013152AE8|nr:type II toxin-antitoxin system RelE/ParE family toxin [Corallococcus sp. AB018]